MRDSSRTCVGIPLWNLLRIDGDSGFLQQAFLSNYIIHIGITVLGEQVFWYT